MPAAAAMSRTDGKLFVSISRTVASSTGRSRGTQVLSTPASLGAARLVRRYCARRVAGETGLCSRLTPGYLPGMRGVLRYWGFLALAAAIVGWVTHTLTWVLILIFAAGALGYFLVQAPVWCGAMTRE